ncbi:diacylglyceryl transferase [Intrasporangium oryzae NRRL B-24470]|uniref:Diacylglyceryl transferase n=1 Tax=Intrasporangium oryzae NRRL B-24470 TaxID=1386089 RepID=W9GCS5_9MICO|nr:prolipoprotein diacylglyceryl transferase family protein [Intrasporangium oryzae]EWT01669.1 diacylglyceryl transferase [Intrasporangium oryzae NRRL B-24470]
MHPVLGEVLGVGIPAHEAFVALGLLVATLVFGAEMRRRRMADPRLWAVVAVALSWGGVFMYAGTWFQHLDPSANAGFVAQFLYGNRSVLGGLAGAYAGALAGKRLTGYRGRTGALFAPAVAAGLAIGRVGCLLTEDPGSPTGHDWGIVLDPAAAARTGAVAGVPLHPSFLYEIAFHLLALALVVRHRDRLEEPAGLLTVYLAAYAVFRFLVEFVRGNEVAWLGLTRPQLFLLALGPLVLWRAARVLRPARHTAPIAPVPPITQEVA